MFISEKIKQLTKEFEEIAIQLYKGDGSGIGAVSGLLNEAVALMNVFIGVIPALNKMGIDVPRDVIDAQVENLQNGLEYKDLYLLADTLKYEINDTLTIIGELVAEGVIKDEQLF